MTTLREFLDGEPLTYGTKDGDTTATYRVGVGVLLERGGESLGTANVVDDLGASRVYHTLTGRGGRWHSKE
jgi:hypothetical protein